MGKEIAIIGGGVIGSSTAWYLAAHEHEVILIDPLIDQPINRTGILNGTTASLGVLMGNVYRRSSGRGWRLRQRSMRLWKEWIPILNSHENPLSLDGPLVQVASSLEEASFMKELTKNRKDLGLDFIAPDAAISQARSWPNNLYGGLLSNNDGRINPLQLQKCLISALEKKQVSKINEKVIGLEKISTTQKRQWKIYLSNGKSYKKEIIVLCTALGTEALLKPLGHSLPITPVLGQVIDLELKEDGHNWEHWPAVLISQKTNLIPYARNRLILGATVEPGTDANHQALKHMQNLYDNAPDWLKNASVLNSWSGLRARPSNTFAPVLKKLEPGLIISTGHYRNGILLAPASAEWVEKEITKEETDLSN